MNVVVVDDERLVLAAETMAVKRVLPNAHVHSFQSSKEAVEFVEKNKVDIAFLDINVNGIAGIDMAKKMQIFNPKINIIFCTGYSEYSLDAHDLYCSAYLMKPVTDDKLKTALENLRHPLFEKIEGFYVRCFGNFEIFKDGEPISFKNKKTKELFAYLIDRRGAAVSTKEITTALYEDSNKESYVRNLRSDLNNTFERLELSDALIRSGGDIGVNIQKIECDYFDYINGNKELFQGEYMSQYSFAEKTLGWLAGNNL